MADEGSPDRSQLARWVSFGATIIAPATVLSAVLFYFGYVSSRAQYRYFGVDVDTIGLSTRDYVMRSPQPLLVPLLVLTLLGVGGVVLHTAIRRRIATAVAGAADHESTSEVTRIRNLARRGIVAGLAVLGLGVVLLFLYTYIRDWALYNLVTPLFIAFGASVIAYSWHVLNLLTPPRRGAVILTGAVGTVALRRSAGVLIGVVVAASMFWATATIAQWSGRGIAQYDARHLDRFPTVILDTQERLYLTDGCQHPAALHTPCIEETALPTSPGQTYHYRYRHFRLLIEGRAQMFLVPDVWSASDSTLVVPLDGSVRVQFQFQNQAP